ncbi:hypothetical protein SANTM175S_03452 [Streptomyces antimycoticus]
MSEAPPGLFGGRYRDFFDSAGSRYRRGRGHRRAVFLGELAEAREETVADLARAVPRKDHELRRLLPRRQPLGPRAAGRCLPCRRRAVTDQLRLVLRRGSASPSPRHSRRRPMPPLPYPDRTAPSGPPHAYRPHPHSPFRSRRGVRTTLERATRIARIERNAVDYPVDTMSPFGERTPWRAGRRAAMSRSPRTARRAAGAAGPLAHAPKPFAAPFTGLAPARRWAGTRSRAGSV